jgi:hypothetical protein
MFVKPEDLTNSAIADLQKWIIQILSQPGSTPPSEVVRIDHFGIFNEGLYLRLARNGVPVKQCKSKYINCSLQGRLLYQKMGKSPSLKITETEIKQLDPFSWSKERIDLFNPDCWPAPWRYMASCPQPAQYVYSPIESLNFKVFSTIENRVHNDKRLLSSLLVYLLLEEMEDGSLSSIWKLRFEGNDPFAYAEKVIAHFRERHSTNISMLVDCYLEALAR